MPSRKEIETVAAALLGKDFQGEFIPPIDEEFTPEEAAQIIQSTRHLLQSVPSFTERMNRETGFPCLFDIEQ